MKNILPGSVYLNDPVPDQMRWQAFREGSAEALGALYYRYYTLLFLRCYKICADRESIKDCIHDLFAEIWKNRNNLPTPASVKAYLICSAQRKLIKNIQGRRRRLDRLYVTDIGSDRSVEERMVFEQFCLERRSRICRAMDGLTKRQREALWLKFYGNMSYPEIAGKMAISKDAVYNLVSKAISAIQSDMFRYPDK